MSNGHPALVAARAAAANLTRAVADVLQQDGPPTRAIDVERPSVGPLAATRVRCPMVDANCDPNPHRSAGTVTLEDLANSLRCAQELLGLMDRGLAGPDVPRDVVAGIAEITGANL